MSTTPNGPLPTQDFTPRTYHRPQDAKVLAPAGSVKPYPIREDGDWDLREVEPSIARPSLRRRRSVITLAVVAFTIGSLLIILCSPYRNEFLAPGPLHSSHAQLLAGKGADRCAACHSGSANSSFGWLAHAFSGAGNEGTQSHLCLECHKSTFDEQFALNPHSVAPAKLAEKTARFENASFVSSSLDSVTRSGQHEIACRACHREHKGSADLKAMTDAQCQSCHQSNFHSFESDHSEFTNWPKASLQNIAFDHATHFSKHFPSDGATFDCNRCHVDDVWQNVKTLAPFSQACASCHEQQIADSAESGVAILALPVLDMQAIEGQKLNVGTWPLAATGDFDGKFPPAMKLLLGADPAVASILKQRPPSFEFADLDPSDSGDVQDAVTLAWSIKRLLIDVSLRGQPAFRQRLEIALGRPVTEAEVAGLVGGLNRQSMSALARRWFPGVGSEVKEKFGDAFELDLSSHLPRHDWLGKVAIQETLALNPLAGGIDQLDYGDLGDDPQPETPAISHSNEPTAKALAAGKTGAGTVAVENPMRLVSSASAGADSGWIRDDRTLRVFYRPSGHEDLFLKHWIDAMLQESDSLQPPAVSAMVKSLTEATSVGNCRYCHTLKRQQASGLVMNWKELRRDGAVGQFTSFSHRPHLTQPVLQDCSHCHRLDDTISNAESFASVDRLDYKSNFHPIEKATCASCHRAGLTDNRCTTCHDYHVGDSLNN